MKKTLTITLAIIAGIVVGAVVLGLGLTVAQAQGLLPNMMGWTNRGNNSGYSMMGGNGNGMTLAPVSRAGVGTYRSSGSTNAKPLTVDQAKQAVANYLKGLNNSDLELKEIMIFDNNAYARITEKSTGIGAMELLVDPSSLAVFPEYGPNMMWNLKYGHTLAPAPRAGVNGYSGMMGSNGGMMGGNGGMMGGNRSGMRGGNGGMMGGYNQNSGSASSTMTVSVDQAAKIAQQYLDQQFPGSQAATDPDPFYGYYTIDILKNGQPTGMLSVNGFSGQVFLHTWHGTFIEMSE